MIRRLNVRVADVARFAELTAKRRPLGMTSGRSTYHLLRETYFDTADGTLADRGMTLRLRAEARGHASLELAITESVSLQGIVEEEVLETPGVGDGLYDTLAGDSEVASRIRDIVEPDALRPQVAVDIDRESRDLKSGPLGRASHRLLFDDVIAHAPGLALEFQEVTLVELTRGGTTLESLGSRLESEHGITSDGKDTFRRIEQEASGRRGIPLPDPPNDVRVGLMLVRDGSVALVEGAGGLMLPNARGSGEEIAQEFLSEFRGRPAELFEMDLVGFAAARRGGSDLEVWMHELAEDDDLGGVTWIPLVELMQRLGGPRLRDSRLVSTLLLLVRSEAGRRLLRDAPHRRRTPPVVLPLEERRPDEAPGRGEEDFLDLELSILDFNRRVLELAEDPEVPLLERFRFLSIFSSNVDEFFVVRVGRLKEEVASGRTDPEQDFSAEQLLDIVAVRVRSLLARQYACLKGELLPALAETGVRIRTWDELDDTRRTALTDRFASDIFPLLTPQALSPGPGRSFPRLASLGLALVVSLRRGEDGRSERGYVPVPGHLDRFIPVPGSSDLLPVEELIRANCVQLFAGATIEHTHPFRATRLGDVTIDEHGVKSIIREVEDEVEARKYLPVIRLEVQAEMPRKTRASLVKSIRDDQAGASATITRSDVYELPGLVGLKDFVELAALQLPDGSYPELEPEHPLDPGRPVFDLLREGDVVCHHPYHDFRSTVGRFLHEAATDPDVVAIKLTLYRTGRRSPIMDALLAAREAGKDVSVFVEVTARFDEESNIHWTRTLREAGANVVYGVVGYKTHAKTALVIRKEDGGVRRYVHVGTGNYNSTTARFYTDLGLMSADPDLGADLNDFFNELTGGAGPPQKEFRRLMVAPHSLASGVERMIDREIEHARAGRNARIQVKVNGLSDRKVVRRLYEAACSGVVVDLLVRSICTLRAGVPGLSEGVTVRSVLGRFLEHARIYYFENAGQSEYWIGSADWRKRNLRRRVEVVAPVDDPAARRMLRRILDTQLDDRRAWILRPDGAYERLRGDGPDAQHRLMATRGGAVPGGIANA